MKRLALAAILAAGCGGPHEAGRRPLRVAAASSLRDLLETTVPAFESANPGVTVAASFEASSRLARQSAAGASFDVFIAAGEEDLGRAGERFASSPRRVVLANRLALIARAGLRCAPDAILPGSKAAIPGPEVPAGRAWRDWLRKAGHLERLEPRFAVAPNARAALALFESGAADYAFLYATDGRLARRAHSDWSPPGAPSVPYVAAAATGAGPEATRWLEFLGSPAFLDEARKLGFTDPPR
jgi:molybdate transport system substrate-binding protein